MRNKVPCLFEVQRLCIEALTRHGFVEFRNRVERPINEEFRCWVGLNLSVCADYVDLDPVVGVHAEKLNRLVAQIGGGRLLFYNADVATYAISLQSLSSKVGDYRLFIDEDNTATQAESMAALYDKVGFPFAQSVASYDALLPHLYELTPTFRSYPELYTACLYLLGRRDEAAAFIAEVAEAAERLRPFSKNFAAYCRATAS